MSVYLLVKWLHVVSSVLLVGTGFGTAFYLYFANRSGQPGDSPAAIALVARLVVRADTWFTAPAVVFQPLSGVWLAAQGGWPLTTPWLVAALALYALAGACWLPVVWLQLRLRDLAARAVVEATPLPARYWRYARLWERLGYPAFAAMLLVFLLMVAKPDLTF